MNKKVGNCYFGEWMSELRKHRKVGVGASVEDSAGIEDEDSNMFHFPPLTQAIFSESEGNLT